MKKAQEKVKQFHIKFNHPVADKILAMPPARADLRAKWMDEEIGEFLAATTITDQADAMADLIYFALGTMVEIGVDIENVFNIVHTANMEKSASVNGEKVKKPNEWIPPETKIYQEILEQMKNK